MVYVVDWRRVTQLSEKDKKGLEVQSNLVLVTSSNKPPAFKGQYSVIPNFV